MRARDAGFEVVYQGIRLTPEQIVAAAVAEDVHLVGISILSGSHMELVPEILRGLREAGAGDVPVVVGGIIPDSDARALREQGVSAVFTPKDFGLTQIMGDMVDEIRALPRTGHLGRPGARPRLTGRSQPGAAAHHALPLERVVDHEDVGAVAGRQRPHALEGEGSRGGRGRGASPRRPAGRRARWRTSAPGRAGTRPRRPGCPSR